MMIRDIIKKIIKDGVSDSKNLEKAKRAVMKDYKKFPPSNSVLLRDYHRMTLNEKEKVFSECKKKFSLKKDREIRALLKTRPVRSLSGIVNVSVLTKPYSCPGECIFCPGEKNAPKSYLKSEPAVMRAIMNDYEPAKQVHTRIRSLILTGHPVDKIELRVIGGTWSYYPEKYRRWFIGECFRACNGSRPGQYSLEREQKKNEKARCRIIGLSVETRPDYINSKEVMSLRALGVTSVEMGVQTIYDDILAGIKRRHQISDTIRATELLKNAGFKISYQMMLNLPGSSPQRDEKMFRELFSNPDFQPDYLKIYPMAILKNTEAYALWKRGKYSPYGDSELKELLKKIKKNIPPHVRIQRLIRDIPSQSIEAGTKISNLRQIIKDESEKEGWSCKCIRCREIKSDFGTKKKIFLFKKEYLASGGKEIFLSFEDKKREKIYSLLRLRIPFSPEIEALKEAGIVREIHTYGQQIPLGKRGASPQHRGLGKRMLKEAEKMIKNLGLKKIAAISGVGARDYYRKLGYRLKDTYMVKNFK